MRNLIKTLLLGCVVAFAACTTSDRLVLTGTVGDAQGDTLFLKHLVNNRYEVLEQMVINKSGNFKFKLEKEEFPKFYFLQVNKSLPLVVVRDSFDLITIDAPSYKINEAVISGSEVSVRLQEMSQAMVELRVAYADYFKAIKEKENEEVVAIGAQLTEKYNATKSKITAEIYANPSSYYAYYALYQRVWGDNLLFSPYDDVDYNVFAAVATSFDVYHKGDPRTKALYEMVTRVLTERRAAKLKEMIDAAPSTLPDIVMQDEKGVERKLSDYKGKVVILNFWASNSPESRSFNKELKALYARYESKGVRVFQISADKSRLLWQEAIEADNLTWTNVCDFKVGESRPFVMYNVKQLPTTFLVNKKGEMINRFESIKTLEAAIKDAL